MFIQKPFHPCPQCGQPQLGTLFVADNVHTRRCRSCFHAEREHLPPLKKKLIYLDQMVLSGIAKELDPNWRAETRRRDGFWLEAFDQIERLVKLQLIVCPESPIHERESSMDDRYEPVLRRLYEHLASGVSLRFSDQVLMRQLGEAFDAWSTDRDPDWNRISRDDVIRGRLDRWNDRLRITAHMDHWSGRIKRRRDSRDRAHAILQRLWDQEWASQPEMPFEDRFREQLRVAAEAATIAYEQHRPGWPFRLFRWVLRRLEQKGVPREARREEAVRFLYSEPALRAPQNHLESLLYAGLARRAGIGQKCPNRGTPNDIKFISAYLPYCDAMFIDKQFDLLLSEPPVATRVKDHPVRIFSTRSRDEFLAYLTGLEAEADPAHVTLVARTYGDAWTKPYRSMLEHERRRRTTTP